MKNVKKKYLLLFGALLFVSSLTLTGYAKYGTEKAKEKTEEIERANAVVDQRVVNFEERIKADFERGFGIDLNGFEKIDATVILNKDNKKIYKSLAFLTLDVINEQQEGDAIPQVFLNKAENKGFILDKRADGTNNLLKISKKDGTWELVSKEQKRGKSMTPYDKVN